MSVGYGCIATSPQTHTHQRQLLSFSLSAYHGVPLGHCVLPSLGLYRQRVTQPTVIVLCSPASLAKRIWMCSSISIS